eukprot:m.353401 g.353401  ORF g.353401 m.353401 type:complete len:226 (-) comp16760_c0_seq1:364-1041(-)
MGQPVANYYHIAYPIFGLLYVSAITIACIVGRKAVQPRNALTGKLGQIINIFQLLLLAQAMIGMLFFFSPAILQAPLLATMPIIGAFVFHVLEPNFLVFFVAAELFMLGDGSVAHNAAVGGCGIFGTHTSFCNAHWLGFLGLLATLYQFITLSTPLFAFYIYSHFQAGALTTNDVGDMYTSLTNSGTDTAPAQPAQQEQQQGYQSYQQAPPPSSDSKSGAEPAPF